MIRVSFLGFLISLIRNMQKAENINITKNKDMRYQDLFKKIIVSLFLYRYTMGNKKSPA